MGFARRVVRKSVGRATPRPVRQAMHPARTVRNAVTSRPVKQISRAAYTVRHPVGAAENEPMSYEVIRFKAFWIASLRALLASRSCSQRVVSMWNCSARAGSRRVCHSAWLARVEVLRSAAR
jgi:hypothetical protein